MTAQARDVDRLSRTSTLISTLNEICNPPHILASRNYCFHEVSVSGEVIALADVCGSADRREISPFTQALVNGAEVVKSVYFARDHSAAQGRLRDPQIIPREHVRRRRPAIWDAWPNRSWSETCAIDLVRQRDVRG
jgi:hypothetical protein